MTELPPGQSLTRQLWQVGEAASTHDGDLDRWLIIVEGGVSQPVTWTARQLMSLPSDEVVMDVHCVTGWSCPAMRFRGVRLSSLLEQARPDPAANYVRFESYSERRHDTSLPRPVAERDCWVVYQVDGQPLPPGRGGPIRVITRGKYFYKSLKWLHRIELRDSDALGFWERESAYHNEADPWQEQRFDPSRAATETQIEALRTATTMEPFRDTVFIRANLSGWRPRTPDLRGLQLKACRFDGADLSHADLSNANLTLSNFFRANLRKANLTGADVEGAKFVGADLSNAKLVDVHLSATTFFQPLANGTWKGPKSVDGLVLRPAAGTALLEDQEQQLRDAGVEIGA